MIDLDQALSELEFDVRTLVKLEADRVAMLNSPHSKAFKDERDENFTRQIDRQRELLTKGLLKILEFPPHHVRHKPKLDAFHSVANFQQSVFIMTKFPDPDHPLPIDAELAEVIGAVCDAVKTCGFVPRLASDTRYHPILWDNVELYLLGCWRGIAIVEDKYLPELNPNVAMEWGWMRGMGRSVLYLVEKDFQRRRADWFGLLESPFEWANPRSAIQNAVKSWLT